MIRSFFQPLRRRLLFLFALALVIPSGFGLWAAIDRYHDAIDTTWDSAQSYSILASNYETNLLLQARQITETLVDDPAVRTAAAGANPAACHDIMAQAIAPYPQFSAAALFSVDGTALCQWDSSRNLVNVHDRTWFTQVVTTGAPYISRYTVSPTFNEPVITYGVPLLDNAKNLVGVIALGVRLKWLAAIGREPGLPPDADVGLLDRGGTPLVLSGADGEKNDAWLPDDSLLSQVTAGNLRRFTGMDRSGITRLYTVNPLAGGSLFVLFGLPWDATIAPLRTDLAVQIGILALMTLTGMLAAAVASRITVTRWTEKLTAAAEAMKLGNLSADLEWRGAPGEIHHLADALQAMAQRIEQREMDLRDSLDQKQMMLREIHHRVKNNLQIVTSLLSLYERQMKGDAFLQAFTALQLRIRTLALVHRYLYESDSLREITLSPFMTNLCTLLQDGSGISAQRVQLTAEMPDLRISGDRAIPLALLTAELVMNAYKYAFPGARSGQIAIIVLSEDDGASELIVRDNGVPRDLNRSADPSDRLSDTLISAFTRQLGGSLAIGEDAGTTRRLSFNLAQTVPAGPAIATLSQR